MCKTQTAVGSAQYNAFALNSAEILEINYYVIFLL